MKAPHFINCWLARPLVGFLLFSIPARGHAESRELMVEVQGRFVHATKAQLDAALVAAHAGVGGTVLSPEQFQIVQTKLAESGADTFSEPRAVTRSGLRAVVEIVREIRYPEKYESSKRDSGKSIPIEFETRNVGVTMEVEPVVTAGGKIDLSVIPTVTRFLGFIDYSAAKAADSKGGGSTLEELLKAPLTAGGVWQPIFAAFKISTAFQLGNGETVFMGGPVATESVKSPPGKPVLQDKPAEENVVVFLTASIVGRE